MRIHLSSDTVVCKERILSIITNECFTVTKSDALCCLLSLFYFPRKAMCTSSNKVDGSSAIEMLCDFLSTALHDAVYAPNSLYLDLRIEKKLIYVHPLFDEY